MHFSTSRSEAKGSAKVARIIGREEFTHFLNLWTAQGGEDEERKIAMQIMARCFEHQSDAPGSVLARTLDLGFRGLRGLPPVIDQLGRLETLLLDGNRLGDPSDINVAEQALSPISRLPKLTMLALGSNQFVRLPAVIFCLSEACEVSVEDNPLSSEALVAIRRAAAKRRGPRFLLRAAPPMSLA